MHDITLGSSHHGMRSYHTTELGFLMVFVVSCIFRTRKAINAVVDTTVVSSKWFWLRESLVMFLTVELCWLFHWEVRVLEAKLGHQWGPGWKASKLK